MRIVSNPVYGDIQGTTKESKSPSSRANKRRLNFSTNVTEESKTSSGSVVRESPRESPHQDGASWVCVALLLIEYTSEDFLKPVIFSLFFFFSFST